MRTTVFVLLLSCLSCGRTTLPCEPTTCAGCCDGYGNCQTGADDLECGAGAAACVVCAKGAGCRQGRCVGGLNVAAGAPGGGSGGGGAPAGGAAGGAAGGVGGPQSIAASTFVPDVLFVVDRSGSLQQPLNPADPMCRGCTTNCPAGCTLRSTALLATADRFFTANPTAGRYGLVLFPSNASCGPPTQVASVLPTSDDTSVLAMMASATMTQLRAASFSGGTPTSLALQFSLANTGLSAEANRDHFLVLVTDGLPNCNPMNTNTCSAPQACQCTTGQCSGQSCTLGCLDRQATLDALMLARSRDVRTLVIGFSDDVNQGSGPQLFDELARAGVPLACPTAGRSECGVNNPCQPDGTCRRAYSNELAA
ncbi:MAG: VWA domain-containing protein, partial [Archangium sp.]|nr:VWA domain-containing protein [Archangium sp.]